MTFNKIRLFDHFISFGTLCTGFSLGHNLTMFRDAYIDPVVFVLGMASVGVGVAGVRWQEGRGEPEEVPAPVSEPRHIPNSNPAPNEFMSIGNLTYETAVKTPKMEQKDARLLQWAYAVAYNNAPMTQKKWCGGKRLFSKPEYERWISCLLEKEVIKFANPKNPAGGYRVNGAQGWQTVKKIADGVIYIPLPAAVLTQEQIRFVSARMRDASRVGEGS
jgi:hypothetical protein